MLKPKNWPAQVARLDSDQRYALHCTLGGLLSGRLSPAELIEFLDRTSERWPPPGTPRLRLV